MNRDELYALVREHVEKNVVPQLSQPEPEIVKEGFFRDFFTAIAEASRRRKKFHDYAMSIGNYMLNRVRVEGGISLELIVSHFDVDNCTFQIGIGYDGEFKDEYGSTNYDENGAEQSSTYKLIKSEAKKAEKKEAVKSFREFEKKEGLFKETMKEYPNIEKIGYIDTDEIGVTIKESYVYQESAVFDDIDKATYARLLKEVMIEQYGDIDSVNEGFLNLFKKKNKEGAKKLEPSEKDIEEATNWLKNPTTLDNYNLTKNVSCLTKAVKVDIQTIYNKIAHSHNLDKENISDILLNGGDGDRKIKIEDLEDEASKEVFAKYIALVPNQFANVVCENGENIYFTSKGKIHCMSTDGITEYSIKDFEDIFGGFYN